MISRGSRVEKAVEVWFFQKTAQPRFMWKRWALHTDEAAVRFTLVLMRRRFSCPGFYFSCMAAIFFTSVWT